MNLKVEVVSIHKIAPLGDFFVLQFPHGHKPALGQFLVNDNSIWKIVGLELHTKYNPTTIRPLVKTIFTCRVISVKPNTVSVGEVFSVKKLIVTE